MLYGDAMLRVEIHNCPQTLSLKLEGRLTGDDAENTRTLITRCREGMRLVVDLTEVPFVDSLGEEVLSFFGQFGAEFVAPTSYTLDVCERLHLRIVGTFNSQVKMPHRSPAEGCDANQSLPDSVGARPLRESGRRHNRKEFR